MFYERTPTMHYDYARYMHSSAPYDFAEPRSTPSSVLHASLSSHSVWSEVIDDSQFLPTSSSYTYQDSQQYSSSSDIQQSYNPERPIEDDRESVHYHMSTSISSPALYRHEIPVEGVEFTPYTHNVYASPLPSYELHLPPAGEIITNSPSSSADIECSAPPAPEAVSLRRSTRSAYHEMQESSIAAQPEALGVDNRYVERDSYDDEDDYDSDVYAPSDHSSPANDASDDSEYVADDTAAPKRKRVAARKKISGASLLRNMEGAAPSKSKRNARRISAKSSLPPIFDESEPLYTLAREEEEESSVGDDGSCSDSPFAPYGHYGLVPPSGPGRKPKTPFPQPIPNVNKESRGRKVPVDHSLGIEEDDETSSTDFRPRAQGKSVSGGIKKASGDRKYVCTTCGKCFVRGEHLKRHVRSLHTYEKPHACPYEGCTRSFSRRDNLAQHVKIHLPLEDEE